MTNPALQIKMIIPTYILKSFRSLREIFVKPLGKLEREVMNEVWRRETVTVRDLVDAFDERLAYTTLMTTLDRLYKKGFLTRSKIGRAFSYSPRFSPEDMETAITTGVIGDMLNRKSEQVHPILSFIVETVSKRDEVLLDELERLVQEKRRELKKEE